jgi:UDP-N-acetylglucosamine--N-acetylmuramyl-(pentapeptide) pyrophosphoryl-undecaprenol N-acetylglucosamine transferase
VSTSDREELRVIMAGGGTGGHLFPALAIAAGLRERYPQCRIVFVGSRHGLEARVVPDMGEEFIGLNIRGIQRQLHPRAILCNLIFPLNFAVSYRHSRRIMKEFQPHIVVGTGGYASGLPLLAAQRMGILTLLQEQNSFPGLTTRRLASKANLICLTYTEASRYLQSDQWVVTGNPVRLPKESPTREQALERLGLTDARPILFILGGSQGSRALNNHFQANWRNYTEDMGVHLLWQTGSPHYQRLTTELDATRAITLVPFIDDMAAAYTVADLVICRAGAMTLAELAFMGRPAVLVPLPTAAADHQARNAQLLAEHEAAVIVPQKDLPYGRLEKTIHDLLSNPDRLAQMGRKAKETSRMDAVGLIVTHILKLAKA